MNNDHLKTLAQVRAFLDGTQTVEFSLVKCLAALISSHFPHTFPCYPICYPFPNKQKQELNISAKFLY